MGIYRESLHPRDPIGRYRDKTLAGTATYIDRQGIAHEYAIHSDGELKTGYDILAMAASGRVWSGKDADEHTRIYTASVDNPHSPDDGNLMMAASGSHASFAVIDHDQEGPAKPYSRCRGSQFQPVSKRLADNQTAQGGMGAALTGRRDRKEYKAVACAGMLAANEKAFRESTTHHVNPAKLQSQVAEARQEMIRQGFTKRQAEDAEMYVQFYGGKPRIVPSVYRDRNGHVRRRKYLKRRKDKQGNYIDSANAKIKAKDLTRMCGALDKEGIRDCRMTVDRDRRKTNALHFSAERYQERDGHMTSIIGTMGGSRNHTDLENASDMLRG